MPPPNTWCRNLGPLSPCHKVYILGWSEEKVEYATLGHYYLFKKSILHCPCALELNARPLARECLKIVGREMGMGSGH